MTGLSFDVSHLLAGALVLVSFMLLYQTRLFALLNVFALQAVVLALSVAWQAYVQDAVHLYVTAAIAFAFKAIIIPVALHRIIARLGIHRDVENVVGIGPTMLAGLALVALSIVVMLRVVNEADALAREDLAFALSVVLLGMLMMVVRRNAVSMVIGFMSLENGLILAAAGAKGMPLVVEIAVAFSVLVAFTVIGVFLFRISRTFRHRRRAGARPIPGRAAVSGLPFDGVAAILILPAATAALLALLPGYRLSAAINVASSFATFVASVSFLFFKPAIGDYFLVDDLNIVFIVLNTFVAFTSSVFSRELHRPRAGDRPADAGPSAFLSRDVSDADVRDESRAGGQQHRPDVGGDRDGDADHGGDGRDLPHARGDRGGVEIFHSRQRRHRAGSVRHHPRLHGGAAGDRRGLDGMVWTMLIARVGEFDPALLNLAFVFLMLGYGTKVGLAPLHAWLPDAHAEGPTPISAVLSGLLLNVALYAVLRFKLLLDANAGAIAPGPLMATLGLVSLIFAAFMLYRRRDIKRLFAFSSIEHMGIIVFAFGMGGALANFAGLLHMTMHSLTKSAIFFTVGHIAQVKGTQRIADIPGLTVTQPWLGWASSSACSRSPVCRRSASS